ncbi:MAG: antibiotic biosynthesis monooxygenase [Tannerella sp.]|jgi:quinol monooxygenase YgiN|nr:antibiotic biosynthesis monooxygenase [Tannerella sp.]
MKKIVIMLMAVAAIGMIACKGGNQTDKAAAACCVDSTACCTDMAACCADSMACCADSAACCMVDGAACCADSAACCDMPGMMHGHGKKVIVARALVKEGQEADFVKFASKLVDATRQEDGNLFYTLYQSTENPSVFLFYEEYKNEAAFKAHSESAHFNEFAKATADMLASTLVIDEY